MHRFHFSNDRLGVLHGLTQDDAPPRPTEEYRPRFKRSRPCSTPPPPPSPSEPTDGNHTTDAPGRDDGDSRRSSGSRTKFRFKKQKTSHHDGHLRPADDDDTRRHDPRHIHHHVHHHHYHHHNQASSTSSSSSKRRKQTYHASVHDDPAAYDDTYIPNLASFKYPTADEAFRESLFDAMADDEGAAFWEAVYGTPLHTYSRPVVYDTRGKLESMEDEEYARYVREKMWEKSHQHIAEERQRREEARRADRQKREEEAREWEEAERKARRRERERRVTSEKYRLSKRWEEYTEEWEKVTKDLGRGSDGESESKKKENIIPWPVKSGRLEDVEKTTVEEFFLNCGANDREGGLHGLLKAERVRWHPDKAQQRWGKAGLAEKELKGITAVFQTIDSLWNEYRERMEKLGERFCRNGG